MKDTSGFSSNAVIPPTTAADSSDGTMDALEEQAHRYFAEKHAAREKSLALTRLVIRYSGNAIRAVHRRDNELAGSLLIDAAGVISQIKADLSDLPELFYTGYVLDALKEYAEAMATRELIVDDALPAAERVGVGLVAYMNGLAECVGELRRFTLDSLRRGDLSTGERLLARMDSIYELLVTLDYPDAVTGSLRRTTDGVRGILEKTRGDLTSAAQAARLEAALATTRAQWHVSDPAGLAGTERPAWAAQDSEE